MTPLTDRGEVCTKVPLGTPSAGPAHEHLFNGDLLMGDSDLNFARSQFPEIIHLLDNERLRAVFEQYEAEANSARDHVRRLGLGAVFFATLALLTVATQPAWPHTPTARWIAVLLESGGMFAALVASGGLWLGPWKQRWLESRLMTERLRQWHFQLWLRRGREIDASVASRKAVAEFQNRRARWLDEFLKSHQGQLDAKLQSLTSELGDADMWLHNSPTAYADKSKPLPHVFRAYEQLRFDHQYSYALHKLRRADDMPIWRFLRWPAIRQASILSALASVGLSAALVCSAVLVYAHAFGTGDHLEPIFRMGAIVAALVGLALRTLQEGLAPEEEIERYNDYRARIAQLRERFQGTKDQNERLRIMEDLERAAFDELRGFLRTHRRARFLLT